MKKHETHCADCGDELTNIIAEARGYCADCRPETIQK